MAAEQDRLAQEVFELARQTAPETIEVKYERWSDTLYIDLIEHRGPSVGIPLENGWTVQVDRATRRPFGLLVENALYLANSDSPGLLDLIVMAEQLDAEPFELKRKTGEISDWVEHLPDLIAL